MNPKCPYCGGDSWKVGFSRTNRQVYMCKSCWRKFNERAGTPFHWLHKANWDVLTAVLLYSKYPLSSYKVSEILELFGVKVSPSSVERWPNRFGSSLERILKEYKVEISVVRRRGGRGGEGGWAYRLTVLNSKGDVVASYFAPVGEALVIEHPLAPKGPP